MPRSYTRIPPEVRLWSKVSKTAACWLWEGRKDDLEVSR